MAEHVRKDGHQGKRYRGRAGEGRSTQGLLILYPRYPCHPGDYCI